MHPFYQLNKQHTELSELNASPGFIIKLRVLGKHHFFSWLEGVQNYKLSSFSILRLYPKNNDLQLSLSFC